MKLEQRSVDGGGVVIALEGEADLAAAPEFQAAVRKVMEEKPPVFVIDFSETTFVNTPIWAVVVEYYQFAKGEDLKFAVAGLSGRVEASFEVVRLGEFIPHYPTVDTALAG